MANRVYVVTDTETDKQRLVRAVNQASAVRHCATRFSAAVAAQDTLIELLADGVKVEDAGEAVGDTIDAGHLTDAAAADLKTRLAA